MSGIRRLRAFGLCLLIVVVNVLAEECDKTKCKGPLMYYKDLKCKPVYDKDNNCCPIKYDCSHLKGRRADKCYANGREYSEGEELRHEDRASPCDIGCRCSERYGGLKFVCAAVDCPEFYVNPKEGCYFGGDFDSCCSTMEVCPKSEEERAKCVVDGRTYTDPEQFKKKDEHGVVCHCKKGENGENDQPVCRDYWCGTELRNTQQVVENCIPYYERQSPRTSCTYTYRCPNANDTVIHSSREKDSAKSSVKKVSVAEDMMCKFNNMTMRIGDVLNLNENCVKCVCEVPPIPTCWELQHEECHVTD